MFFLFLFILNNVLLLGMSNKARSHVPLPPSAKAVLCPMIRRAPELPAGCKAPRIRAERAAAVAATSQGDANSHSSVLPYRANREVSGRLLFCSRAPCSPHSLSLSLSLVKTDQELGLPSKSYRNVSSPFHALSALLRATSSEDILTLT